MLKPFQKHSAVFLLILIMPVIVFGQDTEEACRAFVENAIQSLTANCADSVNHSLCYGTGSVAGTVLEDDTLIPFEFGEDTTGVDASLELVTEARFVASAQTYPIPAEETTDAAIDLVTEPEDVRFLEGLSIIKSSAGLPPQLGDAGLRITVFGNTRVESGVHPEQIFIPGETVTIAVADAALYANLEALAMLNSDFDLVGAESIEPIDIATGEFEAYAISPDEEWLRVFHVSQGAYGLRADAWLSVSSLTQEVDLSGLPVFGEDSYAPMQRIYLTMDEDASSNCAEAVTSGILIQSVGDVETEIWVNDLPIRLSSSVYIQLTNSRNMQVVTLEGFVTVFPGTSQERVMIAGYGLETGNFCLGESGNLGVDASTDESSVDACSSEAILEVIEASLNDEDGDTGTDDTTDETTDGTTEDEEAIVFIPFPQPVPFDNEFLAQFGVLNLEDNDIIEPLPVLVVIQPSGAGEAGAEVISSDEANAAQVSGLCASGALPAYLCGG